MIVIFASVCLFVAATAQPLNQQQQPQFGVQQPQQFQPQSQLNQRQNSNRNQFQAVDRPQQQQQQFQGQGGQRQGNFGNQNSVGANGRNFVPQQQFLLQRQQQLLQLQGQPSLVNIGGCSRGVSLRNSDGSTLVCGFGPRDFACPPGFSCTFDNSLRALICCPGENATKSTAAPDTDPNPCPDGDPIKDEFGHRLKCNFANGPANTCPTGTLCVVGTCCPISVAGLISVKPGQCPLPLPVAQGSNCQNDCTFDADCPGPAKCCFVGCGAKCVASVPSDQSVGNGPTQANVNGPLSGNAASLSQFNLIQNQNRNSLQSRPQQQNFNNPRGPPQNGVQQQQQQQQFQGFGPNNGPPGTFGNGRGPQGPPGGQFGSNSGVNQPQQPRPPQFNPQNNFNRQQFDQVE